MDTNIERRVVDMIAEVLNIESTQILPESHLVEDLGMDSLDSVEIQVAIDGEFNVQTDDVEFSRFKTVEDVTAYVTALIAGT